MIMVFVSLYFFLSSEVIWVFSRYLLLVFTSLILLWSENIIHKISSVLFVEVLWPRIFSILVNVLDALENNVHSIVV